ncbi:MAG: hypothetical protein H0U74_21390 [Bradymonadaceae bacterium]|nr:hypothetical protein [Lujinxingiaceae bacterium]
MLRPALHTFYDCKLHTGVVTVLLAIALVAPGTLALFAACSHSAANQWLSSYQPIVYLAPGTAAEAAQKLVDELTDWSTVAAVTQRTPAEALKQLRERLGNDHVRELGITEAMLPQSLILRPAIPVAGHIDLVSRVAGLEARMEVASIDVPSSGALKTLSIVRWAAIGAALLLGLLGLIASYVIIGFLRALQRNEQEELAVLEIFGAEDLVLRRPSIVRGLAVGLWGGVGASIVLGTALLTWQADVALALGQMSVSSLWGALIVAAPMAIGPLIGLLAGMSVARKPLDQDRAALLRPLLRWGGLR